MIIIQLYRSYGSRGFQTYRMREKWSGAVCRVISVWFMGLGITIELGKDTYTSSQMTGDWSVLPEDDDEN